MPRPKAAGILIGLLMVSGCSKAVFQEFSSKEGRFKVLMPGTPKEKTEAAAGTTMKMYIVEEKNGAYTVAYADIPMGAKESDAQLQQRLDGARDGAIRNVKATLVKEQKIKLADKYPGREFEANLPDKKGILRQRIFLVDKRLYQMMVVGTSSWAGSADATKFLESLALLP